MINKGVLSTFTAKFRVVFIVNLTETTNLKVIKSGSKSEVCLGGTWKLDPAPLQSVINRDMLRNTR